MTRNDKDLGRLASPKTGGPKRTKNGARNVPQSAPEMEPFWTPRKCKNHCISLRFRSKRAPEGPPFLDKKWVQKWAKIELILSRNLGQNQAEIRISLTLSYYQPKFYYTFSRAGMS